MGCEYCVLTNQYTIYSIEEHHGRRVLMKSGFTDFAATKLIPTEPGQTARHYARVYLELDDKSKLSDSRNPEESLANTLDKQVREGRVPGIKRERVGGKYRFFPVVGPQRNTEKVVVQIELLSDEIQDVDSLVIVGKYKNRNDAIGWLVGEGIKANRALLDKANSVRKQIDQLKKDVVG